MPIDPERIRFFQNFARGTAAPMSPLRKFFTALATVGVFGLALMFSVLLFAVVLTAGAVIWGYLWWKTRDLRKQMRDNPRWPGARGRSDQRRRTPQRPTALTVIGGAALAGQ